MTLIQVNQKHPTVPLNELEQSAFCQTEPVETKPLAEEVNAGARWQKIPEEYMDLTPTELTMKIQSNKKRLGDSTVILGHHYQREDIIEFADFRGDSFKLAQFAAEDQNSQNTIFCGVHFMAETAAILGRTDQKVFLPNMQAGCSMADMASIDDVLDCWEELTGILQPKELIPITYMNSVAAIKALCGQNGGTVCTSSNADSAMTWAFQTSQKVIFFPDQHLGRNTGIKLGIPLEEMILWNPFLPLGGNTIDQIVKSKLILWKGHCSVHTRFSTKQIRLAREKYQDINIMVHPECIMEVVNESDYVGSTEAIVQTVSQGAPGSVWGIGTEINLVSRIAHENPDKTVFCLDPIVCPCSTMYRIHPAYLLWLTDELLAGRTPNQIVVPNEIAEDAKVALQRMLEISKR